MDTQSLHYLLWQMLFVDFGTRLDHPFGLIWAISTRTNLQFSDFLLKVKRHIRTSLVVDFGQGQQSSRNLSLADLLPTLVHKRRYVVKENDVQQTRLARQVSIQSQLVGQVI